MILFDVFLSFFIVFWLFLKTKFKTGEIGEILIAD